MARGMLSSAEMDVLKKNPYVEDVKRQRILYTYEFKCFLWSSILPVSGRWIFSGRQLRHALSMPM